MKTPSQLLDQFRQACAQHGIDPATGSNSFQTVDAYARYRRAQHQADPCRDWWADHSLWEVSADLDSADPDPFQPPVAASVPRHVEHAAIFAVFREAFRLYAEYPHLAFYRHPRRCTRKLCRSVPA